MFLEGGSDQTFDNMLDAGDLTPAIMPPTICEIMKKSRSGRVRARDARSVAAKNIPAILFALLALASFSLAAPPSIPAADPNRYLDDIKALTTPAMEGRGDGSKGLTRAAHILEKR
ncbi:MAG: hypothetical protein LAO30_24370, partial [Acidobacteriia bacterium]|nr:hypothetical protein [Terriglobia bacterium]